MYRQLIFTFAALICVFILLVGCGNNSSNNRSNTEEASKDTTASAIKEDIPEWILVGETDEDTYMISTHLRILSSDNCIVFYKELPKNLEKRRKEMLRKTKRGSEYEYTLYTEEYDLKLYRSNLIQINHYGKNDIIMTETYNIPKWEYLLPGTIGEVFAKKTKEIRKKYYQAELIEYVIEENEDEDSVD